MKSRAIWATIFRRAEGRRAIDGHQMLAVGVGVLVVREEAVLIDV